VDTEPGPDTLEPASDTHVVEPAEGDDALERHDHAHAPSRLHRYGPLVLVAIVVLFNLWVLRAEATPVGNLNDGSVHRSMIAWAARRWEAGHLPLDGWYPQLGLGSSRFHHYQSLPHILTGAVAMVTGSASAYSWSLYLMLALWPISVYAGGRLFGFGRWRSACAALASPLIVSAPTLGYEWGSYAWRGYGTWTQAWGMWLLPIAWGLGFRAASRGRSYAWAALAIAMTIAVHLLTGYLALLSLGVFVLMRPTRIVRRVGRAAVVGIGSMLIAAWVIVPLVLDRAFMIQDEFSRGKVYYDSFGATQIMKWAVSGELFDRYRFPVLSLFVALGLFVCVFRWRRDERARALVGVGLLSLILFFGRSTLGDALKLLPGSGDLFLRRYVFGVHLAGLYLIGYGMTWLGRVIVVVVRRHLGALRPALVVAVLGILAIAVLSPAWLERGAWAAQGRIWIHEQQVADATDGADVVDLVRIAEQTGPGRIYGGMRSNWGSQYRVGQVPMYAVLTNLDVLGLGFTRPTWSLASPAEYRFRDTDLSHYDVFDVRWVIQPVDRALPMPEAKLVAKRGRHALYELPTDGVVDVVDVGDPIEADRLDLGVKIAPWLAGALPSQHVDPGITFAGFDAAAPTTKGGGDTDVAPGAVSAVDERLEDGLVTTTVDLTRRGAVVLKASFDNRWSVTVDGVEREAQMFAPGFVGRAVPPGRHEVVFRYETFPRYDLLLLLGVATFLALLLIPRRLAARRGSRASHVDAGAADDDDLAVDGIVADEPPGEAEPPPGDL
jgi:hypothetical protein